MGIVQKAGININPVAGLQQASEPRSNPQAAMPESTSTQSRDYNERNGYGREFLRCAGININPVTFIYWGLSEFLGDYKNFCNYSARS